MIFRSKVLDIGILRGGLWVSYFTYFEVLQECLRINALQFLLNEKNFSLVIKSVDLEPDPDSPMKLVPHLLNMEP
jgi:hypothetical protein